MSPDDMAKDLFEALGKVEWPRSGCVSRLGVVEMARVGRLGWDQADVCSQRLDRKSPGAGP